MDQGGVDAIAQALCGVDERSIEIEDQQFQPFNGERAKFANHVFSVKGGGGVNEGGESAGNGKGGSYSGTVGN